MSTLYGRPKDESGNDSEWEMVNSRKWAQSHSSWVQHCTQVKQKDEWRMPLVYKGNSDKDTHAE